MQERIHFGEKFRGKLVKYNDSRACGLTSHQHRSIKYRDLNPGKKFDVNDMFP